MKPVLAGAGSCIIQAVLNQLRTVPGLGEKVDFHLSQIIGGGRDRIPDEVLGRVSVLIEEAAPWQGQGTLSAEERGKLPADCKVITVPTLHFNSLWPLMTEDPRNQPEPGAPYGRIPFGMGDRIALKIVQSEPDADKRRALYDATDFSRAVNLARSHELEARNLFAREQGCDVRVAGFVMAYFREKRLYYTHNHPTGELMYFVMAQIHALAPIRDLVKLPYDHMVVAARHWADTSNVFAGEEAPVHPVVAAHFGLAWWRAEHRYAWMGEARTFDAWIDWYLRYQPAVPAAPPPASAMSVAEPSSLPVAPYLVTLGDTLLDAQVIAPRREVTRAEFVVEVGLNPALAPNGHLMNRAAAGHYTAAEVMVGALANARVLGTDGLIQFGRGLLGDTVRMLDTRPDAPLIAVVRPGAIDLKPGLPAPLVRHEGPLFCGFAGAWHDFGGWMITTLPRLVIYGMLRARMPELRIVLPAFAAGHFQAHTLDLLGIPGADVVTIGPTGAVEAPRVYTTNAFDLWQFAPFGVVAARTLATRVTNGEAPARHLYVLGPDAGAPANREALLAQLVPLGFAALQLEALPLAERVRAIRGASLIIGEHGSALASILFARPGTPVLELFGPSKPQPLFWTLASNADLPYGYIVGRPADQGYTIPPETLAGAIATMRRLVPAA